MRYLIDTNIIIYYLANNEDAITFISDNFKVCAISIITYYEVLNYNFTQEQEKKVKRFLDTFKMIEISKETIHQSLENRKIKKIKMADNFILASAQLENLIIVTNNEKDFLTLVKTLNPISLMKS